MAVWTAPFTAVTNTVISSSDFNAGVRDNLLYLRQFLSADPGAADKVLVSSASAAAGWTAMVDPTILSAVKVAAATPLAASFTALQAANKSGFFEVQSPGTGGPTGSGIWYCINHLEANTPTTNGMQFACDISNQNELYFHATVSGTPGAWRKLWHAGNDGSGSGLDAGLFEGQPASHYATASSVAAINSVPSGLIAAFRTAAAIAAGWSRFTDGDGRVLVGAGTTFSTTFTENTAVGSSWAHAHSLSNAPNRLLPADGSGASTFALGTATADASWVIPGRVVVHAIKS